MTHAPPNLQFQLRAAAGTVELDVYSDIGGLGGITAESVLAKLKAAKSAKRIHVRINSRGGQVFEALAIFQLLNEHPARVEVDIDSLAASAATLIAMAGDEIRNAPNAFIMVHLPHAVAEGESDDLRRSADVLDRLRDQAAGIYAARTKVARERALEMMESETWLDAQQAVEFGFADKVSGPRQLAKPAAQMLALMSLPEGAPDPLRLQVALSRVERFEQLLGASGDAAFTELQRLQTIARDAEGRHRAQLEKQGIDDRKLNPALIEHYKTKPVADLEAFLKVAPVVVPPAHKQPKTVTGDGQSAATGKGGANTAGDLTWNGKTYAELKPAQRAELHRENPELAQMMRDGWKASGRRGSWLAT